jgi:hypothetical protein
MGRLTSTNLSSNSGTSVLPGTSVAATPPDVRRGSAPPSAFLNRPGLCPWFGLSPHTTYPGQSPNQGRSPTFLENIYGGAEPRLTSGGVAGIKARDIL